jgi:hypothetical protein
MWTNWQGQSDRVLSFLRKNWLWLILGILIIINGWIFYSNFLRPRSLPQPPSGEIIEAGSPIGQVRSALTGEYIKEAVARSVPLAAMIDNYSAARPSTGLNEAAIVFETLVEGGVTRLLGVWQTEDEVEIGPIRSARHYFLPWVKELQAIYVHSGGSTQALAAIAQDKTIKDADEFRHGGSYYRVNGIPAPHDLFSTTGRLQALATKFSSDSVSSPATWQFSDSLVPAPATEEAGDSATTITLDFSISPYKVRWAYDEASNQYRRVVGNAIDYDRATKQQLTARNIIVLETTVVPDKKSPKPDAVVVGTVGEGPLTVFRDGRVIKGKWLKATDTSPLEFFDSSGSAIKLARGRSWLEVISQARLNALSFD